MSNSTINIKLNAWLIVLVLLCVIGGMLAFWQPWRSTSSTVDRTISVTGTSKIKSESDQYVFNPYFESDNLEAIKKLNIDVVQKIKDTGVVEAKIKTSTSTWDKYAPAPAVMYPEQNLKVVNSFQLNVIVNNKELAQKVQDILVEAKPKGQISPSAEFSEEKQKQLKDQASIISLNDAKKQAETKAQVFGQKIGKVIKIDEQPTSPFYPVAYDTARSASLTSGQKSIPIQAGENEFSYSSSVVFELK
jgi:uncharacterized protein YggE